MQKKRVFIKIIVSVLAVAILIGVVHAVLGTGYTTIPEAYVIFDGTKYYLIDLDLLITSYLQYRLDPDSQEAKLAKFYFDTLANDTMQGCAAYVSEVSGKFVSFSAVIDKYIELRNTDNTYIWFNSHDATPAFPVKTKVWVVDGDLAVTGKVWVDDLGYIIPRAGYTLAADIAPAVEYNTPAEFSLTVTGDDFGTYPFTGVLRYEVTGGAYLLEYLAGSDWQELSDGCLTPSGGMEIATDWAFARTLRFTALDPETAYTIKFLLEDESPRPGLAKLVTSQSYETTSGEAEAPVQQFIDLPGFVSIGIAANRENVAVNLHNPEGNPCYFKISLLLGDGTVLYESGLIAPGMGLYEITLTQALAAGIYDAVVKYETFSLADLTPMNGAEVLIKLIAQ